MTGKRYLLNDTKQPQLYRDLFPYSEIPRVTFDHSMVYPDQPEDIWITDTTFRDGQQSRPPYTPKQIAAIFDMLHRLGGKKGVIRQSEFFLYSKRDRQAFELCKDKGYRYPEITSWIRASSEDLKLVKELGIRETGILTSVSDYHIFLKLKKKRKSAMEDYLNVIRSALEYGITPRCHFEDLTRADIYGFCLPFAEELMKLSDDAGFPIKIRLCDTMGYGIPFPDATLPRSVPRIVHAFKRELGYPSELLEWHGHNDFHKVHANGMAAWRYGASALNASLLGFGERTGNPPLEGAVIEYISLMGDAHGVDSRVITEIANYFKDEIKADIPRNYPFIGEDFNTTRAGIHADGLLKNEEIYNIFDTDKLLNRPIRVTVTDKSGFAGIARWINENIPTETGRPLVTPVNKRHPGVSYIYDWVMEQFAQGRTSSISHQELLAQTRHYIPSLFISEFEKIKDAAIAEARRIALSVSEADVIQALNDTNTLNQFLTEIVKKEGSIQLLAITDLNGRRISQAYTQHGEKGFFRNLMNKDFKNQEWFKRVTDSGESYFSDLFFSRYTKELTMTAALPLNDNEGIMQAVIDIDFKFEELSKLPTPIPKEILD